MSLIEMLKGGDHRSIGRADEVVELVLSNQDRSEKYSKEFSLMTL
jgi:hypothetical protein